MSYTAYTEAFNIDNLSLKKIEVHYTKEILNVLAIGGSIMNKYSGDTIGGNLVPETVNTDVEVKRDGDVYVPEFKGSTSKIDCGSYDDLTGDKTFIAWVNPKSIGEVAGRIIENGRLEFYVTSTNVFRLRSDASTAADTAAVIEYNNDEYYFVVGVRQSDGTTNLYVNGVLSGSANQDSGTPVAGTVNIVVGNDSGGTRSFDGKLPHIRVIDGLLTVEEISLMFTSEKQKYGL